MRDDDHLPIADLRTATRAGETTIELTNMRHGPIRVQDIIEIVDRYPGSLREVDDSTMDVACVTSMDGDVYGTRPVNGPLRAHPVDARVRVVSRAVRWGEGEHGQFHR